MNKVVLSGKLTKNAEVNYTVNKKAVAKLNIYEPDQKTFLDITCWEEIAEAVKDFAKDDEVSIEGYIKKRSYEDKDKHKVYVTEILASSCKLATDYVTEDQHFEDGDIVDGVAIKTREEDPFKDFGEEIVLTDDDLPF